MVQIYRACRLYSTDNDSYPPTYQVTGQTQMSGGLGLLWAQRDEKPDTTSTSGRSPQNTGLKAPEELTAYLKSSKALHCPADVGKDAVTNVDVPQTPYNKQGQIDLAFLSYQKVDPQGGDDGTSNIPALNKNQSYLPSRTQTANDVDFVRQLRRFTVVNNVPVQANVPVPSNTIITWCPFHRGASKKPDTVLFLDGSVKRMEVTQPAGCLPNRPAASGWRRLSECSTAVSPNGPPSAPNEGAALAQ